MDNLETLLLNSPIKFEGPNEYGAYEYICIFGTGYIQYTQGVYWSDGVIGSTNRIKNIDDMKKEIFEKFKQLIHTKVTLLDKGF